MKLNNVSDIKKYLDEKYKLSCSYYEMLIKTSSNTYLRKALHECEEIIKYKEYFHNMSGVYVTYTNLKIHQFIGKNIDKNQKDKGVLLSQENYKQLLEYNSLATKYRSNNKIAPAQRVLLHLYAGNYEDAIADLKKVSLNQMDAVLQFPYNSTNDLVSIFMNEKNNGYYNKGRVRFLEEVVKYNPFYLDILNVLQGVHLMGNEDDYIRSLDFYENIIKKCPELIVMCGSTMSQLYFLLQYFSKARDCAQATLNKMDSEYFKEVYEESERDMLIDIISRTYIGEGMYKEALEVRKEMKNDNSNNTYIHNHAIVLYHNEMYKEAERYFKRAIYIYEDETSLKGLADCYMKMRDFENALVYYKKALYFLKNEDTLFNKEDNGLLVQSSITQKGYKRMINQIYEGIVQTYINLGDFENAQIYNDIACMEDVNNVTSRNMSIVLETLIREKNITIDKERKMEEIKKEIENERDILKSRVNNVREWAIQLFDAQDAILDIDNDWDTFENKMISIINEMKKEIPSDYNIKSIRKDIRSRFYYLDETSKDFLCTAEYLYKYNSSSFIDFAPIAIEYSKVIECYLNDIIKKIYRLNKSMTLGNILYNVDKFNYSKLYSLLKDLINLRNKAAHTGICNIENIEFIRNIVYDLIPILNDIKKNKLDFMVV